MSEALHVPQNRSAKCLPCFERILWPQIFSSFAQVNGLAHMNVSKNLTSWQLQPFFFLSHQLSEKCSLRCIRALCSTNVYFLCFFSVLVTPHVPNLRDGNFFAAHVDSVPLSTHAACELCHFDGAPLQYMTFTRTLQSHACIRLRTGLSVLMGALVAV